MEQTKIIIVDDEPLFRELLHRTLSAQPELKVVGEAVDGESAVKIAEDMEPDVVLIDIEMPGKINGIEAAIQIKKERPQTGIVILSSHSDQRYITSLPLNEIQGWAYLLKQTLPDLASLLRAIDGTKAGMVILDSEIVTKLQSNQESILGEMTSRQKDVLKLLAQGYNNSAIAAKLDLSEKTVETYINIIYQILGLSHEPEIHARVKATILYLQSS